MSGILTSARSLNLMGSVNLGLLMNTDFDQALGPEKRDVGVRTSPQFLESLHFALLW